MKKNRKGFTLAEVLVTLAVIGVVAALTIPSLIQNSNTKQAQTSVKKALSTLNQALTMSIAMNGLDAQCTNCVNSQGLQDLFSPHMSKLTEDANSITASDGMIYTFYNNSSGASSCPAASSVTNNDPADTDAVCQVEVDINGERGSSVASTSNNAGTTSYNDLYYFLVLQESVVPANDGDSTPAYKPNTSVFRLSDNTTAVGNIALEALLN